MANIWLDNYIKSGAEAKFKWFFLIACTLGDAETINILQKKINPWVKSSRHKLAEFAILAIGLNTTDNALRTLDTATRTYKTKFQNLGLAAQSSLKMAAEKRGISLETLGDQLVPNFGFEGTFKEITLENGDSLRCFIDNDFTFSFLTEENRVVKTLPKSAPGELKDHFKYEAKNLKSAVKDQKQRLELALVQQRAWSVSDWWALFSENPLLFALGIRLVWAQYDGENKLVSSFRLQEDQSLINEQGEEFSFETAAANTTIRIAHLLFLENETANFWKNNLLEAELQPIFPQLERPIARVEPSEKHQKWSEMFKNIEIGGYTFISILDKKNWRRGSIGDGGGITCYVKEFQEHKVEAIIQQIGALSVGYYEVNAEMGMLMFVPKGSVRFGGYQFDEPRNPADTRLIALGQVPEIVYSETISDLMSFKISS
jgi:hypothetical protein